MPPVSRSSKRLKCSLPQELPPSKSLPHEPSASGLSTNDNTNKFKGNPNSSGLPILPDELFLEILSQFPAIPLDADDAFVDPEAHATRRDTLLALSQTCKSLRRFFKPYVWERVEVLVGMFVHGSKTEKLEAMDPKGIESSAKSRALALELLRQLEIVTIRDPGLADDIRVVNIVLVNYSLKSILQELVRCLKLFSNLHTLNVRTYSQYHWRKGYKHAVSACDKAFSGLVLPSVYSVTVSDGARALLSACPNLRSIGWFYMEQNAIRHFPDSQSLSIEKLIPAIERPADFRTAALLRFTNMREVTVRLWANANLVGAYTLIDGIVEALPSLSRLNVQMIDGRNPRWRINFSTLFDTQSSWFNPQWGSPKAGDPPEYQASLDWERHVEGILERAEGGLKRNTLQGEGVKKKVVVTRWISLTEVGESRTRVVK